MNLRAQFDYSFCWCSISNLLDDNSDMKFQVLVKSVAWLLFITKKLFQVLLAHVEIF